jgi:hypothetical protein
MREPTRQLIERFLPDLKEIRTPADGNWSGIDCSRAERELGFRAMHVWEDIL